MLRMHVLMLLVFSVCGSCTKPFTLKQYYNCQTLNRFLDDIVQKYPDITKSFNIDDDSSITGGVHLIQIAANINATDARPSVLLVGNINGNEPASGSILLQLAQGLVEEFVSGDKEVRQIIESVRVHILPCIVQEDYTFFQNYTEYKKKSSWCNNNDNNQALVKQVSTKAVKKVRVKIQSILKDNPLVLSTIIGGTYASPAQHKKNDTEIKAIYKYIVDKNANETAENCTRLEQDKKDILQVCNTTRGCIKFALTMSCCMFPSKDRINDIWVKNKKPLLSLLGQVQQNALSGTVVNNTREPITDAFVAIYEEEHSTPAASSYTNKNGSFAMSVSPKKDYAVEITVDGNKTCTIPAERFKNGYIVFSEETTLNDTKNSPVTCIAYPFYSPLTRTETASLSGWTIFFIVICIIAIVSLVGLVAYKVHQRKNSGTLPVVR